MLQCAFSGRLRISAMLPWKGRLAWPSRLLLVHVVFYWTLGLLSFESVRFVYSTLQHSLHCNIRRTYYFISFPRTSICPCHAVPFASLHATPWVFGQSTRAAAVLSRSKHARNVAVWATPWLAGRLAVAAKYASHCFPLLQDERSSSSLRDAFRACDLWMTAALVAV